MDRTKDVPALDLDDTLASYPGWSKELRDLLMKGGPRLHAEYVTNQGTKDGPLVNVENWARDAGPSKNDSFIATVENNGSSVKSRLRFSADAEGLYDMWVIAAPTASPGTSHIQIYVNAALRMVNDGPGRTWEFGVSIPGVYVPANGYVDIKTNTQNTLATVPFRIGITRRSS